jgi:uncharacterized coiled-coil protein SlyX
MDMSEIISYLPQINIIGIICLVICFVKIRSGLKADIVMPEIENVMKEIKLVEDRVQSLEYANAKIGEKFDAQFDSMKAQLSEQSSNIAKMQGTLDLLIQKLVK